MHRHRPVRAGFPNGHMMFRGDRRINTHAHTHHPRHRGRAGRTSVDSHERVLPSRRDEEPPRARHSRQRAGTRGELTNGGRAPRAAAHQSTRGTLPPTHSRHHDDGRHTRTPPMLVGDPVPTERPAAQSCKATGNDRSTNSLNRACQETDPGQRSLSRARSSPENRRHRDPSHGHRTWPPPRTGTPISHTSPQCQESPTSTGAVLSAKWRADPRLGGPSWNWERFAGRGKRRPYPRCRVNRPSTPQPLRSPLPTASPFPAWSPE